MTTIGGLFMKYSSVTQTDNLCADINPFLASVDESPKAVKCTKRLYNLLIKHADSAVLKSHYENITILIRALSYMVKGSKGFDIFLTFGLTEKHILSWCENLFFQASNPQDEGWQRMVDDILFNLTVILGHLEINGQQEIVPLLHCLLKCVCDISMPCTAKIEAARGANCLLEVCSVEYKSTFSKTSEMRNLIESMGKLVQHAGNFELQVTIVECLYRMTTTTERDLLATKWFEKTPNIVLRKFTAIQEEDFEVDCRAFLNDLNSSCKERSVHSLSCKRMFLGTFELHYPKEENLNNFWVDFNTGSKSITVFVDDPTSYTDNCNTPPEETVWEMITIKTAVVHCWAVRAERGDFVLSVTLNSPVHSLLPGVPLSQSQDVTITFGPACNPTRATTLVFGNPRKQPLNDAQSCNDKSKDRFVKQSHAIQTVCIRSSTQQKANDLQEISPIEIPHDTPVLGEQVDSQGSTTPTNQCVPPMATPSTSTPKLRSTSRPLLRPSVARSSPTSPSRPLSTTTPTSARGTRPPLNFVSSGAPTPASNKSKSSLTVHAVVCGSSKSQVIQTGKSSLPVTEPNRQSEKKLCLSNSKQKPLAESNSTTPVNCHTTPQPVAPCKIVNKAIRQRTSNMTMNQHTKCQQREFKTPSGWIQSGNGSRRQLSQLNNFTHPESPEDTNSPVLDYQQLSTALQDKLKSNEANQNKQSYCAKTTNQAQQIHSTSFNHSKSPNKLSDVNPSPGTESTYSEPRDNGTPSTVTVSRDSSLCEEAYHSNTSSKERKRVFNLSMAPSSRNNGKPTSKKVKNTSRCSSLNSTYVSDPEPVAIPDSLPVKDSLAEPIDNQNAASSQGMSRRRSKRLNVPKSCHNFEFESEDEHDQSWKPKVKTNSASNGRFSANRTEEENRVLQPVVKPSSASVKSVLTNSHAVNDKNVKSLASASFMKGKRKVIAKKSSTATTSKQPIKCKPLAQVNVSIDHMSINEGVGDYSSTTSLKTSKAKSMSKQERKRIIDEVYNFSASDAELPSMKIPKTLKTPTQLKKKQSFDRKAQTVNSSKTTQIVPLPKSNVPKKSRQQPSHSKVVKEQPAIVSKQTFPTQSHEETSSSLPRNEPADYSHREIKLQTGSRSMLVTNKGKIQTVGIKHNKLPAKKRQDVDHNDFDDLLSSHSKKICQHHGRRSSGYYSHTDSPNNSEESSPWGNPPSDQTFCPSDISTHETLSTSDLVEENTPIVTEMEIIHSLSQENDPPTLPSSPSSSPPADLDVTDEFAQICRNLILKSDAKVSSPISTNTQFNTECDIARNELFHSKLVKTGSDYVRVDGKGVSQPSLIGEASETISLTQLTRDIVGSHKQGDKQRSTVSKMSHKKDIGAVGMAGKASCGAESRGFPVTLYQGCPRASKQDSPMVTAQDYCYEIESELTEEKDTVSSTSSLQNEVCDQISSDLNSEPEDTVDNSSTSGAERDIQRHLNYNSADARDLVTSFGNKIQDACKGMSVQQDKSDLKVDQGTLKLWTSQQQEREHARQVYHKELYQELVILEKDVTSTHDAEKKTATLLKKQLHTLKHSFTAQQRQVDRLRALKVSFYQHAGSLEEQQTKQQQGAQRSLKQDIHNLQKKLLGDYEKKEVSRIKHSLHAMLLQV